MQLVYAGKLSSAKGVPWFLRALQSISSPAWQLHLLGSGSGEEKECCLRLAKELGERVRVHYSFVKNQEKAIRQQIHTVTKCAQIDLSPIRQGKTRLKIEFQQSTVQPY